MKRRLLCYALLIAFTSCSDDDKPKTIPVVETDGVADITTTTAKLNGEITDDGNTDIITSGFVYSSTVSKPTLVDEKIELNVITEGALTATLEELNSGTTYNVRAYATNSVGTGYGEVVSFATGNAAPIATNVSVTGDAEVNGELTATYTYSDAEGNAQAGSIYQWYVANSSTGTGEAAIAGATALTYTIQEAQQGKYIRFGVTPKAAAGTTTGVEVKSAFVGAIGEATTVTFMYNGQEVTYGIINSTTGRKWLDRNLGAPNTPTAVNDWANYGDLFQWGRLADGHQLINRTGPNDADMSGVTGMLNVNVPPYALSSTDDPGHNKFIMFENGGTPPADWRKPQNDNLWQGVNGTNNPCPMGWRTATKAEWAAEGISSVNDGYIKLKLTFTGVRAFTGSGFFQSTTSGNYWASTIGVLDATYATRIRFDATYSELEASRAQGYACRCIKD